MPSEQLPDEDQQRALCEMIAAAFLEIRALARENGRTQIEDLADAFHNIPREMHGWGSWSRDSTRGMLANYQAIVEELIRAKPSAAKGRYLRSIVMASTMGPGVKVDPSRTRDLIEEEAAATA